MGKQHVLTTGNVFAPYDHPIDLLHCFQDGYILIDRRIPRFLQKVVWDEVFAPYVLLRVLIDGPCGECPSNKV